ncbi:MAG: Holliday junction branch migration protein RuvA [Clostridia bacterium]|nr:Holliday junction branch migration protein RuvA [Clostridia bacterium]
MFYCLCGKVIFSDENSVAVDCSGVGYLVFTSLNTLRSISGKQEVTLFTYLNVREDAMELYGFSTKKELESFKLLIGVSGVGPKAAIAVLSQMSSESLAASVAVGDVKAITLAKGVGPKMAQRIVLELKGKMDIDLEETVGVSLDTVQAAETGNMAEAVSALTMLGYSRQEAIASLKGVDNALSTEDMIKFALKNMNK